MNAIGMASTLKLCIETTSIHYLTHLLCVLNVADIIIRLVYVQFVLNG